MKWKESLILRYEGLFDNKIKEEKENKFSSINGRSKIDEGFNWHQIVYKLIRELNTTETKAYKMNYISVLNWLSFFKQKEEVEQGNRIQTK